jgi:hypothetical protein
MPVFVRILAVFLLPLGAYGASGDAVYKTRCALCHDSGATQAPRVGQPNDWLRRVEKGRAGLLRSAFEGVRDTAMLPRAGFPDLGDADLTAAVDYMLSTLPIAIPATAQREAATQPLPGPTIRIDDATLVINVATALHARVLPRAKIEGSRVGSITVEARDGRVALRGMVDGAQIIRAAEETARAVPGVVSVDNRLIGADVFEHD